MSSIQKENVDLQIRIEDGIKSILKDTLKAAFKNPKESSFIIKFMASAAKAASRRSALEAEGFHAPGFLIASVTSRCNLHCAGCYSRCISTTTDDAPSGQLSGDEWTDIFNEASELGINFIIIAGGEPLLRRDIISAAGRIKDIAFPVFTNGTCIDDNYLDMFDEFRNLVPVISIEGRKDATDTRRGKGIYDSLIHNMEQFRDKKLLFGASITVTCDNLDEVMSVSFISELVENGCKIVLFIEFVPVTEDAKRLAPGAKERKQMETAAALLRETFPDLLLLSFPGDELAMGGCMAAGREFFHINSTGGAEPCPFSPFSDINVKEHSLKEALKSPLFTGIRTSGMLTENHEGGCVLYEQRSAVQALLNGS